MRDDPDAPWVFSTAWHACLAGFDVHANVAVPATDRTRLEQLCRDLLCAAAAQNRLRSLADGRVVLTLKATWADGTGHLVFEPLRNESADVAGHDLEWASCCLRSTALDLCSTTYQSLRAYFTGRGDASCVQAADG